MHSNITKPRLQYILFHFFLNSCILFSPIFCFFPFTHTVTQTKASISPKGLLRRARSSRKPWRQGAGHGHTVATLGVTYSHHGELPAELCPTLLDANFFTSYFSFSCKQCRKVKTVDRPHLTFLYTCETSIFCGKRETLNLPCAFETPRRPGLCQRIGQ